MWVQAQGHDHGACDGRFGRRVAAVLMFKQNKLQTTSTTTTTATTSTTSTTTTATTTTTTNTMTTTTTTTIAYFFKCHILQLLIFCDMHA